MYDAWEHFKELLRRCDLNHGFDELDQMQIFYNGLKYSTRLMLDATVGGSMNIKTVEETRVSVEAMASNEHQAENERDS